MKLADLLTRSDPSAPHTGEAWAPAHPVGCAAGTRSAILVVDLEATCADADPAFDIETIEIGLTAFCTDLIGIRQADVDSAPLFPVVADALRAFVAKHQQTGSVWMSWGAYDRKQFEHDSERHGVSAPVALPHQNAKHLFTKAQRIGKEVGMVKACELVGLTLAGTHHRALDDAINIARLLAWALGDRLRVTNREGTG
jgi:inhibitor of KinA sporulation pathway (predicted exonuclease)